MAAGKGEDLRLKIAGNRRGGFSRGKVKAGTELNDSHYRATGGEGNLVLRKLIVSWTWRNSRAGDRLAERQD